jgi:hypothetical protein
MTPAELFTKVGRALCGRGPAWKQQFAAELGIRTDSADAMAKGDSRIPPGVWLDIAGLIQDRERALPALRSQALSLAEVDQVVINKVDLLWMKAPLGDREFFDKLKGEFDRWAAERLEGAKIFFEINQYIILLPQTLRAGEKERLKEKVEQLVRTVRAGGA